MATRPDRVRQAEERSLVAGAPRLDGAVQGAEPARPRDVGPLPDRIRHRFPIFERRVYLNSCSQGALSDAVRDAYERYLADWDEKGAPQAVRHDQRVIEAYLGASAVGRAAA